MRRFYLLFSLTFIGSIFFFGCQSPEMTSAKVYIQQDEYPEALGQLKIEMKKNPTNAEAFFLAGQLYGEMDSLEQMVSVFEQAQKLDSTYVDEISRWRKSKSAESLNKGIKIYKRKKDIEKALKWTNLASEIDPDNTNAWKNLAYLYQEKAVQAQDAGMVDSLKYYDNMRLKIYEKLASKNPDDEEIIWLLAGLYTENGTPDKALKILKPHLENAKEPKVYFSAADAYDAKADTQSAIKMLQKAEALEPDNEGLLFDIGVRYYNIGKFDKASVYFDKVLAKNPKNIDALYNKSLALYYSGKYSEAETATTELLKGDPENTDYWDQLALIWAQSKQGKKASVAAKISKALQKNDIETAKKLANKLGIDVDINVQK